jgi:hypothetical protein
MRNKICGNTIAGWVGEGKRKLADNFQAYFTLSFILDS